VDQWIDKSMGSMVVTPTVDVATLIISLILSFVLCFILALVYIRTHHGYSFSSSFVHTIVFVGITINLIMIIIGSNIARAFALVGAMSIVRFRNPIKDSRDLIFLFMAMSIGMATGTQFYVFAIIFDIFAASLLLCFHFFNFGQAHVATYILRVRMPQDLMPEVESVCGKYCSNASVISIDKTGEDPELQDVVFEVEFPRKEKYDTLLGGLTKLSPHISVNVLVGESSVNV
jgi:hypothetical protein